MSGYHSFWLASARDGPYGPGAKLVARSVDGAAGSHVGQEFDAQALWTVGTNTQLDFGYARIFPGLFLRQSIGGVEQNCIFVNLAQRF
jgi:hypothetical protein